MASTIFMGSNDKTTVKGAGLVIFFTQPGSLPHLWTFVHSLW
jgi:hypothetical protein